MRIVRASAEVADVAGLVADILLGNLLHRSNHNVITPDDLFLT